MVDVRTFRAASMQDALAQVREEMGLEAVILQTKEIQPRRLLRRRSQVEVTAGVGVKTVSFESEADEPLASAAAFSSAQQASTLIDRRALVPRSDAGIDLLKESATSGHSCPSGHDLPPANQTLERTDNDHREALAERLATIEELLVQFDQRSSGTGMRNIPPALFDHYTRLIEADVAETHAHDLIVEFQEQCEAAETVNAEQTHEQLVSLVESQIRCAGPIAVERGTQKVVALVGPTGVGKTTTIAKLAANFRLRDGIKLGLVTVDTYRVAAVEQLRTYADIIDLPMKVVTNSLEMRRAIDELADMDLILIDTAGRSPREELQLQELKSLLSEACVDEVHLVLSLATSLRSLRMTAEKFDEVGVTSLILTKLDEAAGMGSLLGVAHEIPRPLSYFTTGQDVPDDIETAVASRAARLISGEDDLFERHTRTA